MLKSKSQNKASKLQLTEELKPRLAPRRLSKSEKKALVDKVLRRLQKLNPNPRCELFFKTDYQLLVSVVLSAQTTDKMVNRCTTPLYEQGFTPEIALEMGEAGLLTHIRPIGFAPTKAKNVIKLSRILLEKYNGHVPRHREELEALPGVGRKTANVVMAEIFGEPTLAVDTHVFRVTRRLGLHAAKTPEQCEKEILTVIDRHWLPAAHHWFILHGRYTCKALRPLCSACVLNDICPSIY